MTDALAIRPAQTDDLSGLLDLYRHLNPGDAAITVEHAMPRLTALLQISDCAVLLGFVATNPSPVASCTLIVIPNLTRGGAPYALVENVVTHEGYRGQGYGRAVLHAAQTRAWAAGCYKIMLLTGSQDPGTHQFYRASGFEQSKTGYQIRRR